MLLLVNANMIYVHILHFLFLIINLNKFQKAEYTKRCLKIL